MHLCYHSKILWGSEKFYRVALKWNVAQSLNICCTYYTNVSHFCLICILLMWFKSLSTWLFAQTQLESPSSPTKAGEISFATHTVPFINLAQCSSVNFLINNCLYLKVRWYSFTKAFSSNLLFFSLKSIFIHVRSFFQKCIILFL